MIKGYWKSKGKVPIGKEAERKLLAETPETGDFVAVLQESIIRIDIDDYDHATGVIEEPIKEEPRSRAVLSYLDSNGYKYNAIKTEHGIHILMLKPEEITNNKQNWYCPLGLKIEIHATKVFEPLKVNGIKREFIKGSIDNNDLDYLPSALYPLQKSKNSPFLLDFPEGDRNSHISEYAFYLGNKGFRTDDIREIIIGLNSFVLEEPLSDYEIETILRPETIEKLQEIANAKAEKNISHVQIGNEIIEQFNIKTVNGQMYHFINGVYLPITPERVGKFIREKHKSIKKSLKEESLNYVQDITYLDSLAENTRFINVKNGLLLLDLNTKTADLIPHDKGIVSFKQFQAIYQPSKKSEALETVINKFFDNDKDTIFLFKQMLGYLLMNNTIYGKCFFFVGKPSSGKSKILNMITAFCGRGFVSNLSLKELDDKYRTSCIVGKIANINADLEKAKILSSGNFKSFVTGDSVTLERKYGKPFSYVNTAKLLFASNQYPDFSKDSEGVYRRIIIFPCNHVFDKSDKDFNPRIDDILQSEDSLSALLNMAIEGYFSLVDNNGFTESKAIKRNAEEFRIQTDNVLQWLKEDSIDEKYLLREPIKMKGLDGIYGRYNSFCNNSGNEAKPQKDFSRTICNEYGFTTYTKRIGESRGQFFKKN